MSAVRATLDSAGRALMPLRRWLDRVGSALEHPAVRPGLWLAGAIFVAAMTWLAASGSPFLGYDAHAYYDAAALDDPYRETIAGGFDAAGGRYEYKYPPPLAQLLAPVRLVGVPWPLFFGAWTGLLLFVLFRLGGRWSLPLLFFPPILGELWLGNLNLLLAGAAVAGLRWPAAWAFVLLTKITPGIGLAWFAVRREWRQLTIALGATALVAAVSFVLAPDLWRDFLRAAETQLGATVDVPRQAVPISLPLRLVVGTLLVGWGARTDRAWVLPVAVALAVPFLWWNVLAILAAVIPLAGWRPHADRARDAEPPADRARDAEPPADRARDAEPHADQSHAGAGPRAETPASDPPGGRG